MVYNFNPQLSSSQLEFRIRLAEKRLMSYPLDNLDFTLIDIEHPKDRTRHAHQCTSDLTGRTAEFIAAAHTVLPDSDDKYLKDLFHRIMLHTDSNTFSRRFFPYLKLTGDPEAYRVIRTKCDRWADMIEKDPHSLDRVISKCDCVAEGLADFYEMTGDKRYLDAAFAIAKASLNPYEGAHSHGLMTVLRALLKMAKVSGDMSYAEIVRPYREQIYENLYADGSVSEGFPRSIRTEGCSIADFIMLCLRWWDLFGNEYDLMQAEDSMLNGLFFNQFVTGGFGHRNYAFDGKGYGTKVEEAWWCCTQTGGMAMIEFAQHAVQLVTDESGSSKIRINYPIPGTYTLFDGKSDIRVRIISEYPAMYNANVTVTCAYDIPLEFRIPYYTIKEKCSFSEHVQANVPCTRSYSVNMPIGHYPEFRDGGWTVKYGPLLLAPMLCGWNESDMEKYKENEINIPAGYLRDNMKGTKFFINEPEEKDENGFWMVATGLDIPEWPAFDDGVGSHTGTMMKAPANITVRTLDNIAGVACFHPLCYSVSNLTLNNVPMNFGIIRTEGSTADSDPIKRPVRKD